MNERKHRRKLGQNYLIDPVILFEMERSINPQENNFFFEIGPGTGALTEYLRGENIKIIAMDLDPQNIHRLEKKFLHPNHEFIHGDVLNESLDFLAHDKYRLAGNLPYNISTQIIIKLIKFYKNIHDMHFLVQREVALRICALNGSRDWGRLGIKIGAFFQSSILFEVPPEAFDIKPKVQSAFIRLIPHNKPKIGLGHFKDFSTFVDQAFSNKRKNIKNNVKKLDLDLDALGINPLARPEELPLEDFITIFKSMNC